MYAATGQMPPFERVSALKMQEFFREIMSYQLVLQVRGESMSDFDAMMSLEQELAIELDDIAEVDGHDIGCGEINIFILTENPETVFEKSKPSLIKHQLLNRIKAGFRLLSEESYTTIWPMNSKDEFLVA